jgi:signal peptide peptidase SppA
MKNIWLIEENSLETTLRNIAGMRQAEPDSIRMETDEEKRRAYYQRYNRLRDPMVVDSDGVATIEIVGPLMTGATPYDKDWGSSDYLDIRKELRAAMENPAVKSVLLSIDSGGGMALGAPEAAADVAALAAVKPVVAWTGSIMASAAYYLPAAATVITASPSAIVGSIGTVAQVVDITGMLEKFGWKIHTITPAASDLKTTNYPTVPLSDAQRAALQASVENTNAKFTGWVSGHRTGVSATCMRGQTFAGDEAAKRGLVDAVGSFEDARALAATMALG